MELTHRDAGKSTPRCWNQHRAVLDQVSAKLHPLDGENAASSVGDLNAATSLGRSCNPRRRSCSHCRRRATATVVLQSFTVALPSATGRATTAAVDARAGGVAVLHAGTTPTTRVCRRLWVTAPTEADDGDDPMRWTLDGGDLVRAWMEVANRGVWCGGRRRRTER